MHNRSKVELTRNVQTESWFLIWYQFPACLLCFLTAISPPPPRRFSFWLYFAFRYLPICLVSVCGYGRIDKSIKMFWHPGVPGTRLRGQWGNGEDGTTTKFHRRCTGESARICWVRFINKPPYQMPGTRAILRYRPISVKVKHAHDYSRTIKIYLPGVNPWAFCSFD